MLFLFLLWLLLLLLSAVIAFILFFSLGFSYLLNVFYTVSELFTFGRDTEELLQAVGLPGAIDEVS